MSRITPLPGHLLVLVLLPLTSCHTCGDVDVDNSGTVDKDHVSAMLQNPFIDESEDISGAIAGFADPFTFKWGNDYYLTQSVFTLGCGRVYRTRTFDRDDLRGFPISFDFGDVKGVLQVWGFKPYIHTDGSYHAYGSVHYGGFQTEVVHFVPQAGESWTEDHPIQKWRLSRILVGKKETGGGQSYDGLAIRDEDGALYIVVNEQIGKDNCITARRMLDPDTLDPSFPRRVLLEPEGYQSEALPFDLKVTEGTFIQKIQGKYVLVYSTGFFADVTYKVGVAFSDRLIPPEGKRYKKVLVPDPDNRWSNVDKDGMEVKYLLQAQLPHWPNYAGKFVDGPGIGNIVELEDGYYLIFAARRPGIIRKPGDDDRYPWKVPIRVDISDDRPAETWIETVLPK